MRLFNIVSRILVDVSLVCVLSLALGPVSAFHGDLAEAEAFSDINTADQLTYPYTKTFTISAYYSPLPCQYKYTTGSYEGDIRLNGSGVNSADGTPVYPGMVAAPKSYEFGTKMYIPGVGIVAVHDRGGAIVAAGGTPGVYDRLDIWMGYGDIGLKRALNWGKRSVDVTVYGVNDAMLEEVTLEDYTAAEAVPNDCGVYSPDVQEEIDEPIVVDVVDEVVEHFEDQEDDYLDTVELSEKMGLNLKVGDEGADVMALQEELNNLNFYKGEINGIFDELTEHAVFKFQQSQLLVGDISSSGAGIFGAKTRDRLNEIIASRNFTRVVVAQATYQRLDGDVPILASAVADVDASSDAPSPEEDSSDDFVEKDFAFKNEETDVVVVVKNGLLSVELDFGVVSSDVKKLQAFLHDQGYFSGSLTTDYFGPATKTALIQFQLENGIISSPEDIGAGRVGPSTLALINSMV